MSLYDTKPEMITMKTEYLFSINNLCKVKTNKNQLQSNGLKCVTAVQSKIKILKRRSCIMIFIKGYWKIEKKLQTSHLLPIFSVKSNFPTDTKNSFIGS